VIAKEKTMLSSDETTIAALLQEKARAIHDKNADAALAFGAPDIVRYDLAPPLARSGEAARDRGNLIAWFDTWRGPIRYELRDIAVTVSGDIGFAYGFVCIGGTKTDGHAVNVWARMTTCLRKRGGAWTVVHEHVSTPFYMDGSLRAAVDLEP